jgi:hypothetical protein
VLGGSSQSEVVDEPSICRFPLFFTTNLRSLNFVLSNETGADNAARQRRNKRFFHECECGENERELVMRYYGLNIFTPRPELTPWQLASWPYSSPLALAIGRAPLPSSPPFYAMSTSSRHRPASPPSTVSLNHTASTSARSFRRPPPPVTSVVTSPREHISSTLVLQS